MICMENKEERERDLSASFSYNKIWRGEERNQNWNRHNISEVIQTL